MIATTPPSVWETDRLVLRPARSTDAQEAWESYTADPEVSRYMTWRPHVSVDQTLEFFRRCEDVWNRGAAWPWTLRLKADESLAGMLEARIGPHGMDIGYLIVPTFWRRGLMSEALGGLLSRAFERPVIHRVWAVCDVDNVASARLLGSVGMELEGTLRRWLVHPNVGDTPRDCLCYSVVRNR